MKEHLYRLFHLNVNKDKVKEDFKYYHLRVEFDHFKIPEPVAFMETFKALELSNRDDLILEIILYPGADPIVLELPNNVLDIKLITDFLSEVKNHHSEPDSDDPESNKPEYVLNLRFSKEHVDQTLSVVDFHAFMQKFTLKHDLAFLKAFAQLTKDGPLYLETYQPGPMAETQTFCIYHPGYEKAILHRKDRQALLDKAQLGCAYLNLETLPLPEDLWPKTVRIWESDFAENLKKISLIMACGFIFNNFSISGQGEVSYTIHGYRTLKGQFHYDKIQLSDEFYHIYRWIYDEGNYSDKLEIARQVITLNLKVEEGKLEIPEGTFRSILSNHKIFLQKNVESYITVKNKLSEFLISSHQKASDVTSAFAASFKTSSMGFLTFFLSIIVLRLLKDGDSSEIFKGTLFWVAVLVLLGAGAYLIVTWWEARAEKRRFINAYKIFKESYEDILDEEDLSRIFNHDTQHNEDLAYISSKIRYYSMTWMVVLVLTFLAICVMG